MTTIYRLSLSFSRRWLGGAEGALYFSTLAAAEDEQARGERWIAAACNALDAIVAVTDEDNVSDAVWTVIAKNPPAIISATQPSAHDVREYGAHFYIQELAVID